MYRASHGHTQMDIPFVYASYVHWKMVVYQNATPEMLTISKCPWVSDGNHPTIETQG